MLKNNSQILSDHIGERVEKVLCRGKLFDVEIIDVKGNQAHIHNLTNGRKCWLTTWMPVCTDICQQLEPENFIGGVTL